MLQTLEPLRIDDAAHDEDYGQPGAIQGEDPRSCVFVPLVVGRKATGVVSLQNLDREHAFSEADVRLLTTIAGNLSVALENARLFEETRQRNAELALINDVQRSLAENLEMHAMYELIGIGCRRSSTRRSSTSACSIGSPASFGSRTRSSGASGIRTRRSMPAAWVATSCRRGSHF